MLLNIWEEMGMRDTEEYGGLGDLFSKEVVGIAVVVVVVGVVVVVVVEVVAVVVVVVVVVVVFVVATLAVVFACILALYDLPILHD